MLPSLSDLGIESGSFIRKLNNHNHWNAYLDESLDTACHEIANKIFGIESKQYSLWQVRTDQEFYGVVAALTADAHPQNRDINFIWIREAELEGAGIAITYIAEGKCIDVKGAHVDAFIGQKEAENLCRAMLLGNRKAERCKRRVIAAIREHQQGLGCKAVVTLPVRCACEGHSIA